MTFYVFYVTFRTTIVQYLVALPLTSSKLQLLKCKDPAQFIRILMLVRGETVPTVVLLNLLDEIQYNTRIH
jgi:hypothetical protein